MAPTGIHSDPLALGALFHARYRVLCMLGRGAMGVVYEVQDERTGARRAMKVMSPSLVWSDEARERFQRETRIVGAIQSEHVVTVTDAGAAGEVIFVVMELLRGRTIADLVADRGRLPPEEALALLTQIARGLEKIASAGIVHRDIKPENVFVTRRDDDTPCAKIVDFGLAKVAQGRGAPKTRPLGTPLYMAPEQVTGEGEIGPAADLYALGHLTYTMLVGETFWRRETETGGVAELMTKIVTGITEQASSRAAPAGVVLPAGFDAWFDKATNVDPNKRFESARAQAEALSSVLSQKDRSSKSSPPEGSSAEPAFAATQRARRTEDLQPERSRSRPIVVAAVVAGALITAALSALVVFYSVSARETNRRPVKSATPSVSSSSPPVPQSPPVVAPTAQTLHIPAQCPGDACAPLVVADRSRIDPLVLIEQSQALAASYDSSAQFSSLSCLQSFRSGAVDLGVPGGSAVTTHKLAKGTFVVSISTMGLVGNKEAEERLELSPMIPACPISKAWPAALKVGLGNDVVLGMYGHRPIDDMVGWMFTTRSGETIVVDADCSATNQTLPATP